jgi:hypothetical protein
MEHENYMIKNNLSVDNIPNCKLEHVPLRTVKVDVTLSGDKIKVLEWKFWDILSLSDHPYISYEVEVGRPQRQPSDQNVP